MFCSYINLNVKSSSKYCSYYQKVVEWDLLDKPKKYIKHCLERISKVEQIDSNDIQIIERNRLFKVKSSSKEIFHQLDLGDKYSFPTCTCHDWKQHLMPCKHFLAPFEHKTRISWNSLGDIYRKSPYFNIDYEVFGLDAHTSTLYPAADNYDVCTVTSFSEGKPSENNISIENYRELSLSKQKCKTDFDCRENLKQLKSLTYIITDTAAPKELNENLIDVRDKFSNHAPVDHGLVVEHPKIKMELEKNVKRKLESFSLPRKKIKLTGRAGAASEARKFSSNIKITEKALKDLTKNEISGIPLRIADKNSSEGALFLKGNAKKENETQPKHSKENILANISTSNNAEDVTYNHLEQIRSKHADLIKSNQTGNVTVFSKIIPQFSSFLLSSRLLKNVSHTITYLDLLSLERTITASELSKIKKYDKNFKTGWLHDEIINSFPYQLTNRNEELLYCDSIAASVISEGKSFKKLWKDQDISKKSMIIIPFNPNNCHWILVVVSIKERAVAV